MHPRFSPRISRRDLQIERSECLDEGKDLSALESEFAALDVPELVESPALQERAVALLDRTALLPVRGDYLFVEPSRPEDIRRQRGESVAMPGTALGEAAILDKVHGAWTGRCCGCMLGKPVEGRLRIEIEKYLRSQGRWPLDGYFSNRADEALRAELRLPPREAPLWAETMTRMVEDDDLNYTVVGLALTKRHGRDLLPAQVLDFWLHHIPYFHTYTAERAAYASAIAGVPAPDAAGDVPGPFSTATWRNPYREWIGAQIRADFFGYCHPGRPDRAAATAWRDAAASHVKNGIYGEMWVAAMLAAAWVSDDIDMVIRAGLAQVPRRSRLVRDLEQVLAWRREGRSHEDVVAAIHETWDENFRHHWCHTNSNAQIVAAALLWGEHDFGRTLCLAVGPGFDTDCNGATAGSVLGLMLGRRALPPQWTEPLRDTLATGVAGYYDVKLIDVARQTVELARQLGN